MAGGVVGMGWGWQWRKAVRRRVESWPRCGCVHSVSYSSPSCRRAQPGSACGAEPGRPLFGWGAG
eukprot:3967677-Alexandrium_andersonii.AAC.1